MLAIVPIISLPTFIPELNRSFTVLVLSIVKISFTVLAMDIATSITAPRVAKIIVEMVIDKKSNSGCMENKCEEYSDVNPVKEAVFEDIKANSAANIKLRVHPIVAAELFLLKPPTKYIVIVVESTQIRLVANTGFIP